MGLKTLNFDVDRHATRLFGQLVTSGSQTQVWTNRCANLYTTVVARVVECFSGIMAPTSPIRPNPWKEKAKATSTSTIDPEFVDLEPVITYRHVLSNNLGVKDPLRVIALCDSDAFYAACEMVRLDVDKETPLVVLQWDALIAVNYPARKYGITRMIKLKEALKLCPELKVVHVATYKEGDSEPGYWENVDTKTHKVSLDYYRRESMKIAGVFKENLPASVEIGASFCPGFVGSVGCSWVLELA